MVAVPRKSFGDGPNGDGFFRRRERTNAPDDEEESLNSSDLEFELDIISSTGSSDSSPRGQNQIPLNININNSNQNNSRFRSEEDEESVIYKEVVIIGNGPSGITMSYFLAGNWPYYNGLGEDVNDMLHYRLLSQNTGKLGTQSLVEQDLTFLAQGLEGRSSNPIALLFDTLNHPQADLGLELPSLLTWRHRKENSIDHVVIGKGPPGGAWQSMDGNVLTISRGCWMELPQMNFRDWEAVQQSRCVRESRATVASVAQYYCDYVEANHLEKFFKDSSVITEVTLCHTKSLPKNCHNLPPEIISGEDEDRNFRRHTISEIPVGRTIRKKSHQLWKVKGYSLNKVTSAIEPFNYLTRNLVLATGSSNLPNILNVKGENLPFVLHSLNDLEHLIASGHLNQNSDPVMVIGAGLSAADAIIAARFHSIPVIHVYRRSVDDKNLIFRRLPVNMYPEYHKVYQMMQYPSGYEGYKVYEQRVVVEILPDRRVKLAGPYSCGIQKVSYIVICIGSHPDLSFLGGVQYNIGAQPGMPIDCKRNPLAINFATHESVRQPGLYALGPLVGENFVRFVQGGALAITNHLIKRRNSATNLLTSS